MIHSALYKFISNLKRLACAGVLFTSFQTANAVISLDFSFDPSANSGAGSVTATYNGSWDVASSQNFTFNERESSDFTFFSLAGSSGAFFSSGINGPYPWSTAANWDSRAGDTFGLVINAVYGPANFTSSTPISGSMTRSGSLTDLGFSSNLGGQSGTLLGTPGTVQWTTSVVPESSQFGLLLGCGVLFLVSLRRTRHTIRSSACG